MSDANQEDCLVMRPGKHERRAGARFSHLLRQLEEEGWTQTAIAEAIGCHQTLISKWRYRGDIPHDLTRKGIRDDVIQGIYEGLGIRSDYLFMPRPKGYPNSIKTKDGETRLAAPDELDHRDFKVVSNQEFEAVRERKERAAMKAELHDVREQLAAQGQQLAQLLAILARDAGLGR
jgi:transcriptional regulator with XRE-family HTH domain